jgi:TctA family transporter
MAVSFRVGMGLATKSTSYTHGYPQAVDGFRVFLVLFATFSVGNAP